MLPCYLGMVLGELLSRCSPSLRTLTSRCQLTWDPIFSKIPICGPPEPLPPPRNTLQWKKQMMASLVFFFQNYNISASYRLKTSESRGAQGAYSRKYGIPEVSTAGEARKAMWLKRHSNPTLSPPGHAASPRNVTQDARRKTQDARRKTHEAAHLESRGQEHVELRVGGLVQEVLVGVRLFRWVVVFLFAVCNQLLKGK